MSGPIIGILGNTLMTQPGRFSSIERAYINSDYADGVIRNGGIPVMIPAASMMEDVEAALGFCDGILFPGGEDMNPWYYHEEPLPQIETTRPEIDEAWMKAGHFALERKIPIFGICKGIQLINVLCGGSLYQDIYAQRKNSIMHLQFSQRYYLFHHVEIRKDTYLAAILGEGEHPVNSMHHQAVKELGANLVVSALAPDGTIEAIESRDGQIVAVQWHPEGLLESAPEMNKLFRNLVERSMEYQSRR